MQRTSKQHHFFDGVLYPLPIANPLMPKLTNPKTGVILRSVSPEETEREALQSEITKLEAVDRSRVSVLHVEAYENPTWYTKLSDVQTTVYVREREAKTLSQPVKKHFKYKTSKRKRWSEK